MDRALKERIIGAIVLVAVAVLVVPVFLDGPPGDAEMISERVPLPGQSEQKVQTVVLDRDREEPVPARQTPGPEPEADAEEPAAAAPVKLARADTTDAAPDEPAPEQTPTVVAQPQPRTSPPALVASSSTGMWAVQLGSFGNQQNAERLAADLRKQGFAAFLSQLSTDSGQLHRVRIGPQKDRESAEAMAARLAKAGHKGQVVPHP